MFPIFSYLWIEGKCRYCKEKVSIQYPLVELATGILFVLIFNSLGFNLSLGISVWELIRLCFLLYIACSLIVIFVYDLKHYLIPDKVLFPAIIVALVYDLFNINCLVAAGVASGFFLTIFLISKGKWMGFGDVKLAILLGLILGWPNILVGLFLAFLFGAIIGLIMMVFEKKNLKSEIPFGPFLITGTLIAMLWGNSIIQWYFNFFKI